MGPAPFQISISVPSGVSARSSGLTDQSKFGNSASKESVATRPPIPPFTRETAIEKVRLAVPDFKSSAGDAQNVALLKTFNDTLWNDLDNSGVVELVSKSFYPLQVPGQPAEVTVGLWSSQGPLKTWERGFPSKCNRAAIL